MPDRAAPAAFPPTRPPAGGTEIPLDRLCDASREHHTNPYTALEWPDRLDRAQWFTSPELVSLWGTDTWEQLGERQQRELSFWEAAGFYSLNIHGEKTLMAGLVQRLYPPGGHTGPPLDPYLHHLVDEENKHGIYFGGFCTRYAGKVYPDRVRLAGDPGTGDPPGAEDLLFFARVLVFEEIVDRHNVQMAGDVRLAPLARRINLLHHEDETRHIAFGRRMVARLAADAHERLPSETLAAVRDRLAAFLHLTWRSFHDPAVYADAGLPDPVGLARSSYDHPAARHRRQELSRRPVRFLVGERLLDPELAL